MILDFVNVTTNTNDHQVPNVIFLLNISRLNLFLTPHSPGPSPPLPENLKFLHASWEVCVLDQICVLLLEAAFLAFTKNSTR